MTDIARAKEVLEICILRRISEGPVFGRYNTFFSLAHTACPPTISRDLAGALLRDMRDRGLTLFGNGLMDEDGYCAGAGYAITPKGLRYLCAFEELHGGVEA